jgi:hypothetical protein
MPDQSFIGVFVKLQYWDAYRASVALTARQFRLVLCIFGIMGALMLVLLGFAVFHPTPEREWFQTIRNTTPLVWVFGLPILFVFVLPLLTAWKVVTDERIKRGITYRFSDAGIHIESSVATVDLKWAAIRNVRETRMAFLLLPSPNIAHTLPMRCFANETEIAAVRELLRANVPMAKLHRT